MVAQIESILCQILQVSREEFFRMTDISSSYIYAVQQKFFDIKNGVPEEYAIWKANFYGRDFFVDQRVLIPRNDTEVLVGIMLDEINQNIDVSNTVYVDVWTWSWCIPISIVEEIYPLKFYAQYALDISPEALEVAKMNAKELTSIPIDFRESNLLEGLAHEDTLSGKNLCITANLPYIKNGDTKNMDASVVHHEPDSALYWWAETGFELYKELIKQCFGLKKILELWDIVLAIEIWFDQWDVSREYLTELWLTFEYFQDSASIERVILIRGF